MGETFQTQGPRWTKVASYDNDIAFLRTNTYNSVTKNGQTDTKLIPKGDGFEKKQP